MAQSHVIAAPIPRPDLQAFKQYVFSGAFFLAFMALCCRGVLEVTIGKVLAYAVQLALWTTVQFAAIVFFRSRITSLLTAGIALTFLFGVTAVISSVWTLNIAGSPDGWLTTMVNVYLLLLFVVGYGFITDAYLARPIVLSMAMAGTLLPIFGALQLMKIAKLPGQSLFRPPSLTGSYLHFPLLCGVLGICLLQAAKSLRWRFLYLVAGFCFFGVGISAGRSGALVLVATGLLYIFFEFRRRDPATRFKFAVLAFVVVALFSIVIAVGYQFSPSLQRIARLWDLQEGGNALRVAIWTKIYDNWSDTNLWFGEYTGLVGNTSNSLAGSVGLVAESGVLQQLINFGVLGFLIFYSVMLLSYLSIDKEMTYLRALLISAIVQTSFYQSTEVFPYMAMLALLPAFSRCLRTAVADRYSNQGR